MKQIKILLLLIISVKALNAQTILPTPEVFELNDGTYTFAQNVKVRVNKNSSVLPFLEEVKETRRRIYVGLMTKLRIGKV